MSKNLFKKFVKNSCKEKALKFLLQEKESLSKLENNSYCKLEMQNYLKDKIITIRQKKLLFRLRTRMVKVGYNFGRKILCPLCGIHSDDKKHKNIN